MKEILYAEIFNSTITNSKWLKNKSFSPGRWAIDYAFLYTLYKVLNDVKPSGILEYGLGQSSKMIYQYVAYYTDAFALTIEHDEQWEKYFKNTIESEYEINVKLAELETIQYKGYDTLSYKKINDIIPEKKFDLILLDAPFGSPHYSRSQILDLIPYYLSNSFCIILDDYDRPGERETFVELCDLLKKNKIDFTSRIYSGNKDHVLLCSSDWRFLTSL
ncbi:MAG TPA: hypothetical protein VG676_14480 [Chitinophagaceae bacterium]|nr:hypothetical protein [Chitinophagaceae bacterium]